MNWNVFTSKLVLIPVLMCLVFLFTGCSSSNNTESKTLEKFYFSYSVGVFKDAGVSFELKKDKKQNKYIASYKNAGVPEKDSSVFTVNQDFVNDLSKLLNDKKILKWNGFRKSDSNVLDGTGFSFLAKYENGKIYSASGYEKYPNNYSEGKSAIESFYSKAMKERNIEPKKPIYD